MKKFMKYITRAIAAFAIALFLSILNTSIAFPVNVLTISTSVLFGAPGIALSLFLCNYLFK